MFLSVFCSTQLIPTAMALSKRYFDEAPVEISSQYDYAKLEGTHDIARMLQEDPKVVVDAVVDNVSVRWPSYWNYAGWQAFGLKYFSFLPRDIMEFIQVTCNPAPRPVNDDYLKPKKR
jgi:hypothetical protein